jgi:hypothetical protein
VQWRKSNDLRAALCAAGHGTKDDSHLWLQSSSTYCTLLSVVAAVINCCLAFHVDEESSSACARSQSSAQRQFLVAVEANGP